MEDWIVALISTIVGTILGWALQLVRRKKIYIDKIEINPKSESGIFNAYFDLKIHNSGNFTRAIRDPCIVCRFNKKEVFEERVQSSKLYKNKAEKEKAEEYRSDIDLIEIPANGNISQYCKIEFFEFGLEFNEVYFQYIDEKFKTRRVKVLWNKKKENKNG